MPWWVIAYAILFALVGVAGAFDELRCGDGRLGFLAQLVSTGVSLMLLYAYFESGLSTRLGALVIPAFVGALTYEIYAAVKDLRNVTPDKDLSSPTNQVIRAAAILFVLPPHIVGGILSVRSMGLL